MLRITGILSCSLVLNHGFLGLLDYADYLALGVGLGVLNQDFQYFEDFLVLGVGLG